MNKRNHSPENTVIAFDLHEVIVRPDYKKLLQYGFANLPKKMIAYGFWPLFWLYLVKARRKSKIPEVNFNMMARKYKGLKEIHDHFIAMSNMQQLRPEMVNLITRLREKKYPIYLFSNIGPNTLDDIRKKLPLDELIDGYFTPRSEDNFLHKPHHEFYEMFKNFIERYHSYQKIIFIDDKKINIKAANASGITGIQFKNAAKLSKTLEDLGL